MTETSTTSTSDGPGGDASSALDVVATLQARPGRADDLAAIVTDALAAVRAEQGCLRYDFFAVRRDEGAFVMMERWASKEALRAHGASEHFRAMSARLGEVVAEAPVVRVLDPIDVGAP